VKRAYINTLINKVAYAVVTFVANALVTRALGVELKGEYTWILTVASIIAIIGGLGVYQSIPFFNREEGDAYDIAQKYVNIFVLMSLIYIAAGGFVFFLSNENSKVACISLLAVVDMLSQQLNMLMLINNIFVRNKIFIAGSYINLILSGICYFVFQNDLYIAVSIVVVIKLFYIVAYLVSIERVPRPFQVEGKHFLKVVRFGYLPMLSFLLITLNYKVDVLMLEGASSITNVQLSYYTTGVSIAELAWFIPDVFKEVLFNKTAKKNNYKEISSILRVSNAVLIVIILAVIVLGRFMIRLFYGQAFAPAYEVTILLFLGIPAMSWFKIIYTLFNAQGRRKTSFSVLLASTLINILVNYFAIPHFGIYGAALASVLSYSVCGIVFIFLYGKISGEKVWSLFILRKGDIKTLLRG
jgi:O-antigen/teichoic acid export membrane protein